MWWSVGNCACESFPDSQNFDYFCSKHVNRCKRYDTITLKGLQTNITNKVDGGVRLGLHPNICQVGPLK